MKRSWILLPLFAGLLLSGTPGGADERPPQNLHLVGDHWTAWEPPAVFPEGAEVYTIERDDTLWDLAARFYGDPYLWPQLWERNQWILDAHWIYPGDPLLVSVEIVPVETLADLLGEEGAEGVAPEEETSLFAGSAEAAGPPRPLGSASDIQCSGYVGGMDEPFPFAIVGSEHGALLPSMFRARKSDRAAGVRHEVGSIFGVGDTARYGLANGDIVYIDGGRGAGLSPGEVFTVVAPRQKIDHPLRHGPFGRLYTYQGRVQVISVQEETSIAEIVHACDPINVGQALMPYTPEPVPLGRDTPLWPVNFPAPVESLHDAGVVLHTRDEVVSVGQDSVVYIDLGEGDDVVPGDIFTIYRINREGLPPVVLGELAVLSVHERSSVAKILKSRYTVRTGDRLLLK